LGQLAMDGFFGFSGFSGFSGFGVEVRRFAVQARQEPKVRLRRTSRLAFPRVGVIRRAGTYRR